MTPILRTNSNLSQLLPESIMVWLIPHLLTPEYNVTSPNKIAEVSRAETSAIRLKNVTSDWFSAPQNVAEPLSAFEGLHSAETGQVNCETIGKSAAGIKMEQGERFVRTGHYFLIKRWDWVKKKKKVSSLEWPWHELLKLQRSVHASSKALSLALAQNTASNRLFFGCPFPLETLFLHLSCLDTGHSDFSNYTTSFPSFPLLICPPAWQAQSPRLPLSKRTPAWFSVCALQGATGC